MTINFFPEIVSRGSKIVHGIVVAGETRVRVVADPPLCTHESADTDCNASGMEPGRSESVPARVLSGQDTSRPVFRDNQESCSLHTNKDEFQA